MTQRRWLMALLLLTLGALALRVWRLDVAPPGWRDDELINSLVISQKVLDGDWAVYYPDASGHEALYHALNALFLGLFGPTLLGIRALSVLLGTLSVVLTAVVGRRLLGARTGLLGAALLAVSFWSLMYSRIGLRHISLLPFTLLAFSAFWRGLAPERRAAPTRFAPFLAAGVALGLGLYTYFAARGVPFIFAAFALYLALFDRPLLRRRARGLLLMLGVTVMLALPLMITLQQQPEAEARVTELAAPLVAAWDGDWRLLGEHVRVTLAMFHATGDSEWLYNIPGRPLFHPVIAGLFWLGVATAVGLALRGLPASVDSERRARGHAAVLLLGWWLAGIAPAFVSIPAASLSHTILAQPAVYLLLALPLAHVGHRWHKAAPGPTAAYGLAGLAMLLVALVAARDWPAYFTEWPQRGNTRFLYHADQRDVARAVAAGDQRDFAVAGLLDGPWTAIALDMELAAVGVDDARPRWFHAAKAVFVSPDSAFSGYPVPPTVFADWQRPAGPRAGGYDVVATDAQPPAAEPVCFVNGLCWETAVYDSAARRLELGFGAPRPLDLPDQPLISNPPPPGVDSRPRLSVFVHLLDADGALLAGADGLWVAPDTLRAGDRFVQAHFFPATDDATHLRLGLYDPQTGQRVATTDGRETLEWALSDLAVTP